MASPPPRGTGAPHVLLGLQSGGPAMLLGQDGPAWAIPGRSPSGYRYSDAGAGRARTGGRGPYLAADRDRAHHPGDLFPLSGNA
jgi:hypothetical protein